MAVAIRPGQGGFSYAPGATNPITGKPRPTPSSGGSSRGGGGGGSSRPAPTPNVRVDGNTVIIDGQGFSVAPSLQAEFIRNRTGGAGASAQEAIRVAQENAKRAQEQLLQQRQAEAEKIRIENLRKAILLKGAQEKQQILKNKEGDRIRTTTTTIRAIRDGSSINTVVWKYENLDTGKVRYRAYEAPRTGGGRQLTGGIDEQTPVKTNQTTNTISNRPVNTIEPYQRQKGGFVSEKLGLGKLSESIRNYRNKLRTKLDRNEINSFQESQLLATGFVSGLADTIVGLVDLPQTLNYLRKNPAEIKRIPSQIKDAGNNFAYLVRTSPTEAIGYVGGTLVAMKGTDTALRSVARTGNKALTKLNPKYVGEANIGSNLKINVGGGKKVNLKVVGKIPKQSLARQIDLAGKRVNAISSQADDLFGLLNKRKTVRKPIPGEARFNPATKKLLQKFDSGRITRKELAVLNSLIRKQGAKGLLERTFFADPSGKIRPSRLGITQERGGIFDLLSGDVTFRKSKPQIFFFSDIEVSRFPKSLQNVARKVKAGKQLTNAEANRFLEWQLRPTGKFKPLGFATRESEITLAPGEILRKTKKIGVTIINGKKVPIYKVEVYTPKGAVKTLLNKLDKGKITPSERLKLKRLLQRETGINYGSSYVPGKKYVNIKYLGYNSAGKLIRSYSRTGKSSRPVRSPYSSPRSGSRVSRSPRSGSRTSRSPTSRTRTSRSPLSRSSSGKSIARYGGSSAGYRGGSSKKMPMRINIKSFKPTRLSKVVQTFYVVEKVKGKFKKLYPKPLTQKDARDYAVYSIDNRLSRTAFFIPLGKAKTVVRPPKPIQDYASKNAQKVRPYRIRFGKRRLLVNGYIEKRRFFTDTPGEKKQLRTARRVSPARRRQLIKQLEKARAKRFGRQVPTRSLRPMRRSIQRKPQRRISSSQRKELLKRLAKARAVRMRMLRRKRR